MMKWFLYYGGTILANVIAVIVFHDKLNLTAFSLFPAVEIVSMAIWAWYCPGDIGIKWLRIHDGIKYQKDVGLSSASSSRSDYQQKIDRVAIRSVYICIPFLFMFIPFFSNGAKVSSTLIFAVPLMVIALYSHLKINQITKQEKQVFEKELQKQREKEELGKWK